MRRTINAIALVTSTMLVAGCKSYEREFSEVFLVPASTEMIAPSELGLDYEPVTIKTGADSSIHGWFIPSPASEGRTVLFLHDNGTNISFCAPYYTFLHEAGFNVFLYDYQGFGKSEGYTSIDGLVFNADMVLRYLYDRKDVDSQSVAIYAVGIGTVPALRSASRRPWIAGLVLEDVVSPDAFLQQDYEAGGSSGGGGPVRSYASQFLWLPWHLEPEPNAKKVRKPILFLTGQHESNATLQTQIRTFGSAAGPKALWIIPNAGSVPASIVVRDAEYQAGVVSFLEDVFAKRPDMVSVSWQARATGGGWSIKATLSRDAADGEPWPVEICALGKDGTTYSRVWLTDTEEAYEVNSKQRPVTVSAWRYHHVRGSPESTVWRLPNSELSLAAQIQASVSEEMRSLRAGDNSPDKARSVADTLIQLEEQLPLPPALNAQLAEIYWRIGEAFISSEIPEERDDAERWLERCISAAPAEPSPLIWTNETEKLRFEEIVASASLLLAESYQKADRADDAVRVLEAALEVSPEDVEVRQRLAELRT